MKIQALGHVVLKVRNLERAIGFYNGVLGLRLVARKVICGTPMAFFAIADNHHDLALMEVGGEAPAAPEAATGLAHLALKIGNSLEELRAARGHLESQGTKVDRTIDHRVSQSLYLRDPDGNTIELYVDADPNIWRDDAASVAHSEPFAL
jgi:catechol 2,3-dioxygenase